MGRMILRRLVSDSLTTPAPAVESPVVTTPAIDSAITVSSTYERRSSARALGWILDPWNQDVALRP
jgi:hypothetical protein